MGDEFDTLQSKVMDFFDARETGDDYAIGDSIDRISECMPSESKDGFPDGLIEVSNFCYDLAFRNDCPRHLRDSTAHFLTILISSALGESFLRESGPSIVTNLLALPSLTNTQAELLAVVIASNSTLADMIPLDFFTTKMSLQRALLFEPFCQRTSSPLPPLINLIANEVEEFGPDSDISKCMLESLHILRKRYDITPALIETDFYNKSTQWFPMPPDCLCLILTIHTEAMQDGVPTNYLSWQRYAVILNSPDISSPLLATTLWSIHVFTEHCSESDIQSTPREFIAFISHRIDAFPYQTQKHALLAYASIVTRTCNPDFADPDLLSVMEEIAAFEDDDSEFVADLEKAIEMFMQG